MSVTIAGMSHRRRGAPGRLFIAILAISVALNICVVAGAVWNRLHPPASPLSFTARLHSIENSLDLTAEQRTGFDRYITDMSARSDQMRHVLGPIMDAVWDELAKPDADQGHVSQLLDDANTQRHTFQRQAVNETFSLLATLTPEQRAKFIAAEREFHAAQRRRHAEEAR